MDAAQTSVTITLGTFSERSIADTAANAAPAGLPPCPLVAGDPEDEDCWGDTLVGDAPGGRDPAVFVRLTGCFCRLTYDRKKI